MKSPALTYASGFAKLFAMSHLTRQFIAILMLLWLPLSSGSALAASLSMQSKPGHCHEMMTHDMQHHDMAGHHHVQPTHEQGASSNTCGACHLACCAYLAAPAAKLLPLPLPTQEYTPLLVSFDSITTAPLLPPPLVRS